MHSITTRSTVYSVCLFVSVSQVAENRSGPTSRPVIATITRPIFSRENDAAVPADPHVPHERTEMPLTQLRPVPSASGSPFSYNLQFSVVAASGAWLQWPFSSGSPSAESYPEDSANLPQPDVMPKRAALIQEPQAKMTSVWPAPGSFPCGQK